MANRRELVKRRKSVRNIRKITRTMQLISTARFQAALNRAVATRPYTEKLAELIADLAAAATDVRHPLMQSHNEVNKGVVLAITSNRGLCGGYNANVLRRAVEQIGAQSTEGLEPEIYMVGKKGINYFRFLRRPIAQRFTDIGESPRFDQVEPIANELMDRFNRGELRTVHVVYMKFHSIGTQSPEVMRLLPLATEEVQAQEQATGGRRAEYEFSPEPEVLLGELLPAAIRVRLFQAFNDAVVSEHIARMVAMKAATDAAGDMIRNVTRQYNRARQTAITMELLDIVGGANALA